MSNTFNQMVCIDIELRSLVSELVSRREFSSFIQDCLRSHKKIIEAESLEHESEQISIHMNELQRRRDEINSRLEVVKVEAEEQRSIIELERELRRLNEMKNGLDHWEQVPRKQRPKAWHEWNNKRQAVSKTLKDMGFDFTKLRDREEI